MGLHMHKKQTKITFPSTTYAMLGKISTKIYPPKYIS